MRRVLLGMLILLVAAGQTACGPFGDDDDGNGSGVRIDDEDAGSVVQLSPGETLVVELDGNPSTGYNWYVKQIDESVLKQAGEPEFTADRNVPGSSGIITLRFTAVAKGSTTLNLAYFRQFEPDVPPVRTFEVAVEVR